MLEQLHAIDELINFLPVGANTPLVKRQPLLQPFDISLSFQRIGGSSLLVERQACYSMHEHLGAPWLHDWRGAGDWKCNDLGGHHCTP